MSDKPLEYKPLEYYLNHPVPDDMTFEGAIALSQHLLGEGEQVAQEQWDEMIQSVLPKLLKTRNGARGFFVTFLTQSHALADDPSPALLDALRSEPEVVAELMVKNLAMSSAMTVMHQRQGNADHLAGSRRVKARSSTLIHKLNLPEISTKMKALWATLQGEGDEYTAFLDKWNYDGEQRAEICRVVEPLVHTADEFNDSCKITLQSI